LDVHVELEREVRAIAAAAGVDFETAMAEAEAILKRSLSRTHDGDIGPSEGRHDRQIVSDRGR
jgi:hypothetical protein